MAALSSDSGLGFYTTATASHDSDSLDVAPSALQTNTDTVFIEEVNIKAILGLAKNQTYYMSITFVATPAASPDLVSKRWSESIETASLTEADFVAFMNDLTQFGQFDADASKTYNDSTKTVSDFS